MNLIVLAAFDRNEDGELVPAFDARETLDADQTRRRAALIKDRHAGVIAWTRQADPDVGEFGPPEVLVRYGEVPEMD